MDYRVLRHQANSIKETLIRLARRGITYSSLRALDSVSFEVCPGQVLGIIGPNGAGKSTLMRLLARVLPPTEGRVRVRGRVAPMIELGAGFNFEQTGEENIILYGALLGRDVKHMKRRSRAIAEWAGVSDFFDVPVRAYSSGMLARLAFSVAVDVEPDVLLIDEILSVGDEEFQKRSMERIEGLISGGAGVVLVSHNLQAIIEKCDTVIWLDHGKVVEVGSPKAVVGLYSPDFLLSLPETRSALSWPS